MNTQDTQSKDKDAFTAKELGIRVLNHTGLLILSPISGRSIRRILYVNSYGGRDLWQKILSGLVPGQHLWGVLELVRQGYEVALAEPLAHFNLRSKKALPHDLHWFRFAREWLRPDDIIYCGHTLLYWLPLLKALGVIRCHIVSLCYAREELDFIRSHSGVIAMTPAAADEAKKKLPQSKVAHLGWGCDLSYFPSLPYNPETLLSCGITNRDFSTLSRSASVVNHKIRVICPGLPKDIQWSKNVNALDGGKGWNTDNKRISFRELLHEHYSDCRGILVVIKDDPTEYTANGFTNLLEAMAMGRPVIMTKTGAVPSEIDIERVGCGIFVPPKDAGALAQAMNDLASDRAAAEEMGKCGKQLIETHYNMNRFATDLHRFFESL